MIIKRWFYSQNSLTGFQSLKLIIIVEKSKESVTFMHRLAGEVNAELLEDFLVDVAQKNCGIRATASKYLLPFAYGNAVKTSSLLC